MPLEKQVLSLPMVGGLDQKKAEKHTELQKLAQCDNGVFSKTGEIEKRKGFSRLGKGLISGSLAKGQACASYKDERLVFDGIRGYTRSSSGTWVDKGSIVGCTQTEDYVDADKKVISSPMSCSTANGFRVESWAEVDPTLTLTVISNASTTVNCWRVYSRVIDTATGAEVIRKTRVDGPVGSDPMKVTKSHEETNAATGVPDSSYINPQVQTVAIDDYIYTLFLGWYDTSPPEIPTYSITGAGASGGSTELVIGNHRFMYGDTVTITGTTSYNGTYLITGTEATTITILETFVATETGTASFTSSAIGVYTSVVNTGSGIHSSLTPTTPTISSSTLPAFYVNGRYPLFSVDKTDQGTDDEGAVVFRYAPNHPGVEALITGTFRADFFKGESGTFAEDVFNSSPGLRGFTSKISTYLASGYKPYFQGDDTTYSPNKRTLSHIAIKAIDSQDRMVAMFTLGAGSPTVPEIFSVVYEVAASLIIPVDPSDALGSVLTTRVLSSAGIVYDTGDFAACAFTAQKIDTGSSATPDAGQAADHEVWTTGVNLTDNSKTGVIQLRQFSTVTTDLWKFDGRIYFGATRAITPTFKLFLTSGVGTTVERLNFGSSVNLIADFDGNIVSATGTGLGGNCLATDWPTIFSAGRAFFWHVQRVENPSTGIYSYGSSRGGGVLEGIELERGDFSESVFNPSYCEADFSPARYLPSVEAGGSLMTASGVLWEYSGDMFKESGFLTYPQIRSAARVAVGGTLGEASAAQDYTYRAIYEWVSVDGSVHRSYPSDPVTVTIGSGETNSRIDVVVYTPQWTQKRVNNNLAGTRIVLYRTENGGSTVFYRTMSAEGTEVASSTITIQDTLHDNDIRDNEQIYSTGTPGDILGNIAPPSQTDIALHKDRVFVSTVNGSVWYSKKIVPRVTPEFSEMQIKPVENYTGSISTIGSIRDYLVIFTESHGYYLSGEGPNAAGGGADFSPITRFAEGQGAATGCARVSTPEGFIYESGRGLYSVNPSMQVQYVGASVEDDVAAAAPVGAALNDARNEAYFFLGGTQDVLVYNYYFGEWSKWTTSSSFDDNAGGMVHNGDLNLLHSTGYLSQQGVSGAPEYRDTWSLTEAYSLVLKTAWLRSSIFLGLARFYRLLLSGTFNTSHSLTTILEADYDPTLTSTSVAVTTTDAGEPHIYRLHLKHQKARAVRFSITLNPGTYNVPCSVDGIALEVGVKRTGTTFKLAKGKTL